MLIKGCRDGVLSAGVNGEHTESLSHSSGSGGIWEWLYYLVRDTYEDDDGHASDSHASPEGAAFPHPAHWTVELLCAMRAFVCICAGAGTHLWLPADVLLLRSMGDSTCHPYHFSHAFCSV